MQIALLSIKTSRSPLIYKDFILWTQTLITCHYGQIWVENCPSGGSCFHFTLPVYKP